MRNLCSIFCRILLISYGRSLIFTHVMNMVGFDHCRSFNLKPQRGTAVQREFSVFPPGRFELCA